MNELEFTYEGCTYWAEVDGNKLLGVYRIKRGDVRIEDELIGSTSEDLDIYQAGLDALRDHWQDSADFLRKAARENQ